MAEKRLDQRVGQLVEIVTGGTQAGDIRHLDAVDPFHGHDIAARALPVDRRNAEARIILDVFGNF